MSPWSLDAVCAISRPRSWRSCCYPPRVLARGQRTGATYLGFIHGFALFSQVLNFLRLLRQIFHLWPQLQLQTESYLKLIFNFRLYCFFFLANLGARCRHLFCLIFVFLSYRSFSSAVVLAIFSHFGAAARHSWLIWLPHAIWLPSGLMTNMHQN